MKKRPNKLSELLKKKGAPASDQVDFISESAALIADLSKSFDKIEPAKNSFLNNLIAPELATSNVISDLTRSDDKQSGNFSEVLQQEVTSEVLKNIKLTTQKDSDEPEFQFRSCDNSTEILRINSGKPTEEKEENLLETYGNYTEILRINSGKPTEEKEENLLETYGNYTDKPTEQDTDILRKTYGNTIQDNQDINQPIGRKTYGNYTDSPTENLRKNDFIYPQNFADIRQLVGFQKMTFYWIASHAKKHGSYDNYGNRVTPPIYGRELAQILNKSYKSTKDIFYELEKKNYLQKLPSKPGPGGFTQFSIFKLLYQDWLHLETVESFEFVTKENIRKTYGNSTDSPTEDLRKFYGIEDANKKTLKPTNIRTTYGNSTDKPTENSTDTDPSMYVCNNLNNTIHTEDRDPKEKVILEDEWTELYDVDFSQLLPWNIKSTIVATFKKNKWSLTRLQFEEFIERFVRYFTEDEFKKRRENINNPYSFFLSSIKAISKGEPDPICDIKTQFELAQQIALENKMKELEANRKKIQVYEAQVEQYQNSEFEAWLSGLSNEAKEQIVSPQPLVKIGSVAHDQMLKAHFREVIWPNLKKEILGQVSI